MKNEIVPLRELTPNVPVTTNMMGTYSGLNYWKMAPVLDVVSWDSYPAWHGVEEDWKLGSSVSFIHDIYRCLKGGKPFLLMESTPSNVNWQEVCKLKRAGMHRLSSLQAVAHGADTVQYFQWRKSRGSFEKFHGAVVDHVGHENTRVFRDVAEVGQILEKLYAVIGTTVHPEVGIIYDWENEWAIGDLQGLSRKRRDYGGTCVAQYRPFWSRGVPVNVVSMDSDFASYRLLIAPMLYMVRPGVAERIDKFVRNGGTFVATYGSGIVNESDLCFLGGFPGPLRRVLGIWAEEIDALHDGQTNVVIPARKNGLGLTWTIQGTRTVRPHSRRICTGAGKIWHGFLQGATRVDRECIGQGPGVLHRLTQRRPVPRRLLRRDRARAWLEAGARDEITQRCDRAVALRRQR